MIAFDKIYKDIYNHDIKINYIQMVLQSKFKLK